MLAAPDACGHRSHQVRFGSWIGSILLHVSRGTRIGRRHGPQVASQPVKSPSSPPPEPVELVPAKFRVPSRRSSVSRSELIGRVRSSGRPLVVVTAPAGYGKTTLLVELASVDDRVGVWATLDRTDDDPVGLARCIATALATRGLAARTLADEIHGAVGGSGSSASSVLGKALLSAEQSFLLILDDAHLVADPHGSELIDSLVGWVPAGSQIVVAGQVQHPYVAGRRVSGELVEIGMNDLALDGDGVRRVFEAEGVTISSDQATAVAERTEGWAAGAYLSALTAGATGTTTATGNPAAGGVGDVVGGLDVKGSSPYFADYLFHHVLDRTSPDLREFLLDAALLDELHPSLCDEALAIESSATVLHRLERANMFVVASGPDGDWYRLHTLFREFLLGERPRRSCRDQGGVLQRASDWCLANHQPDQAVEYLLRTRDVRGLGRLLATRLVPVFDEGRATTAARWIREAGEVTVDQHPPLAALAGWLAALGGRPTEAEELAARMEHLSFDGPTEDGWRTFSAARAAFDALLCAHGVATMNHDAELALEGAPSWNRWHSTALWLVGFAREMAGDRAGAAGCYEEAVRTDIEARRQLSVAPLTGRAFLAIEAGDWRCAAEHVEMALITTEVAGPANYIEGGLAHAAAARVAVHGRDEDRARNHLEAAMSSIPLSTYAIPHAGVRLRTALALSFTALGDRSTAATLLAEADRIVTKRPGLGALVDELDRARELLAPGRDGHASLTPAELRVLELLPTHLNFAEIGEQLFVSRHTVHTHAGSIYRKFGISSRSEAVSRARELGLV